MREKLIVGIKLFLVAALSGGILFLINDLTAGTIEENRIKREEEKYSLIFPEMDSYEKEEVKQGSIASSITIKDETGTVIGTIYAASANNDYGSVSILVGIDGANTVSKVEYSLLNQTPSYASKVNNPEFLGRFTGNESSHNYADFDVKVGATYSATTTRDLVAEISAYHEGVK